MDEVCPGRALSTNSDLDDGQRGLGYSDYAPGSIYRGVCVPVLVKGPDLKGLSWLENCQR